MPLFEGYIADKNVVILDIGSAYTKCGVAGETCPRCIVPSEVTDEKTGTVQKIWNYNTEDELFNNLRDLLTICFFRKLLLNPKDRRVVICENLFCPQKFRDTLANVLFNHFEIGSLLFAPSNQLSLLPLGTTTALVLDVGHREAVVVPLCEGFPVLKAVQARPTGGEAIHRRIKEMLLAKGKMKKGTVEQKVSDCPECLTEEILEDIKVRCCFVTKLDRAKKINAVSMNGADESTLPFPPPSVEYPLDGSTVLFVDGNVREQACEVMFEQDNERTSITTMLLDAIIQSPVDVRVALSQNILITGGTAMLPGFHNRVQLELKDLLAQPQYAGQLAIKTFRFHQPPCKPNYTAWLGGALIGATETLPNRSVSREVYQEDKKLLDWCTVSAKSEQSS